MLLITGATGHIGNKIAEIVLKQKKPVGVIGRSADRLGPLVKMGATAFVGTLEDASFLGHAFADAEAVFTMIPPDMQAPDIRAFQNRISDAMAAALKATRVRYVVNLSSIGGQLAAGNGPIAGLHDQEERLNEIKHLNVVHLRPAFFMENTLMNIPLIKAKGINGTPLKGDLRFPTVATRDIAQAASAYLLARNFSGMSVRELLGPRDMSMNEITRLLGGAIGKPDLAYIQFPYEAAREAMLQMGLSADMARLFIEMYQGFNEGRLLSGIVRTPGNTTPTTFEEFVREFAAAYKINDR